MNVIEAKANLFNLIAGELGTLFSVPSVIINEESPNLPDIWVMGITDFNDNCDGYWRELSITYDVESDEVLHTKLSFGKGFQELYTSDKERHMLVFEIEKYGFKVDTVMCVETDINEVK
jgi:hypothetical protein